MSTPPVERYQGYEITVQAIRRPKTNPQDPADAPREYDCIVNIARQASGESGKTEMFGVPTTKPFNSPVAATRAAIEYARNIIDGKVDGVSIGAL